MNEKFWEQIEKETYRAEIPTGWIVLFVSPSSGSMVTVYDPHHTWKIIE